jgi:hypothetical protein
VDSRPPPLRPQPRKLREAQLGMTTAAPPTRGLFFYVLPMPDGGWTLTARGIECGGLGG